MGYQNFFASRLYTDIGTSDTTITLETAPTATSGRMVLEARNPTQREIISYSGVSGNQLTGVTRGIGGTTAKSHLKTALIEMNLVAEDISDLYDAFDTFAEGAGDGWFPTLATPNTVTYNGNRSYTMVFNGNDLTDTLSPGMRLRTTRTVAAPTQCADLESSSSQYFSRASGSVVGMTFTDDFTVSAWVKLESYTAGVIVSRQNGNGWELQMNSSGQLLLIGYNTSGANFRYVQTYQSIPLNKWVHIAGQLDMSAYTLSSTTCYMMIDGVDVPSLLAQGGTNPTALTQGGNLEIGSKNGGTSPFDGKIAQVAVYSAKVTQANIRATISQGLTGSETSLVCAYSLNGVLTDLSANANTLTANGGATTTNADSPFSVNSFGTATGTTDYGIVTSCTFSTNTTVVVQVPEGNTIPTTGGVSAVSYSTQKAPFGFPAQRGKWRVLVPIYASINTSGTTVSTFYNPGGIKITVPIGSWVVGYDAGVSITPNAQHVNFYHGMSSSSSTSTMPELMTRTVVQQQTTSNAYIGISTKQTSMDVSASTDLFFLMYAVVATTNMQIYATTTEGTHLSTLYSELALL